jgi:hypothetical protein
MAILSAMILTETDFITVNKNAEALSELPFDTSS